MKTCEALNVWSIYFFFFSAHLQVPHFVFEGLEGWRVSKEQKHELTFESTINNYQKCSK